MIFHDAASSALSEIGRIHVAPPISTSPLTATRRKSYRERSLMRLAPAKQSFQLLIGTRLSCWTTGAVRWFPSKIQAAIAQKTTIELLDTRRRSAMPCVNAPTSSGRDHGLEESRTGLHGEFCAGSRRSRKKTPRVQFSARVALKTLDQLPEMQLHHINTLTDDTGILQHAIFTIPNRAEGYTTDDNARALIFTVQLAQLAWTIDAVECADRATVDFSARYICHSSNMPVRSSDGSLPVFPRL